MLSLIRSACRALARPGPASRTAGRLVPALLLLIAIAGVPRASGAREDPQGPVCSSAQGWTETSTCRLPVPGPMRCRTTWPRRCERLRYYT